MLAAIDYHLLFWVDGVVYVLAGMLIVILLPKRKRLVKLNRLKATARNRFALADGFLCVFCDGDALYVLLCDAFQARARLLERGNGYK